MRPTPIPSVPAPTLAPVITNRQRTRAVRLELLRRIAVDLVRNQLGLESCDLGICLLAAPAMTRLNEKFVGHAGVTDVIAFDYADPPGASLHGEIFLCVDEAVRQARRFRTTWPAELVRYLAHGVLHLRGYDDHRAADRRRMKREEDRLLRALAAAFPLAQLGRSTRRRSRV